ncbi:MULTISPECIES: N-acetylmuramoyl-L-alanine amidase family protein [unclassified Carboxylicivirga]|uniref:N-acetylmuramoyl-L-alanine amidase family protein n=1 Tax=Carboxylicivirga TaxID=1628153 RepID=UPI003D3585F7
MTTYIFKTRVLLNLLIGVLLFFNDLQLSAQETIRFKTVVIDAGHGGRDSGALGKFSKEKDIVLDVALQVGAYIKKYMPDINVVYTRKSDVFVPLSKRADIANEHDADLFLSIHANAISTSKIYGAETFVLGLHRTDENLEVAKLENSVITLEEDYTTTYEGFDPNSAESYIIFELMQNIHIDQSIQMASLVQSQFKERVGRKDRGVKQAGFLVLRRASMPSVLIELGFLTNHNEEKFIASEKGKTYMASAIFRAVRAYKEEFDSKSRMEEFASLAQSAEATKISYRIQVASSKKAIRKSANIYERFTDVWEFEQGGRYKYTTQYHTNYEKAQAALSQIREEVKDAFLVAFKGDQPIPLKEAVALQQ